MDLPQSASQENQAVSQHLCVACESDMNEAQAEVVKAKASVVKDYGRAVVWTPLGICILSFLDSINRHVPWTPDDRIIASALIAGASILAFAFPTKEIVDVAKEWLLTKVKKSIENDKAIEKKEDK